MNTIEELHQELLKRGTKAKAEADFKFSDFPKARDTRLLVHMAYKEAADLAKQLSDSQAQRIAELEAEVETWKERLLDVQIEIGKKDDVTERRIVELKRKSHVFDLLLSQMRCTDEKEAHHWADYADELIEKALS